MGCYGPLRLNGSVWCQPDIALEGMEARSGEAPVLAITNRMIGFDGRHQWRRQKLFKLHAKPSQRKKCVYYNKLVAKLALPTERYAHPKFAIRSFLVRRTRNEQVS
jgi:hypothetical protein